uniref:Uncharacterized protein n=1 Tax=Anguilla anguilla TaxID=7936 RepID=A0A0E9UXI0_ANGAN
MNDKMTVSNSNTDCTGNIRQCLYRKAVLLL